MRSIVLAFAVLSLVFVLRAEAGVPTTQPFTLQPQTSDANLQPLYSTPRDEQMQKLLEQRYKLQQKLDAYRQQSQPRFDITIRQFPPDTKPQGEIEHWSGVTRPALMHISPNIVQTFPGHYALHQDQPRIVQEELYNPLGDQIGAYRRVNPNQDLPLIDDRPKQQK